MQTCHKNQQPSSHFEFGWRLASTFVFALAVFVHASLGLGVGSFRFGKGRTSLKRQREARPPRLEPIYSLSSLRFFPVCRCSSDELSVKFRTNQQTPIASRAVGPSVFSWFDFLTLAIHQSVRR
jgi:hypothetical protein